jgi:SNF2 family DNA or RNA helicase
MHPLQAKAYKEMKDEMVAWVHKQQAEAGQDEILEPIIAQAVISKLIRLQQFAAAYAHLDENFKVRLSLPSSKIDAAMELVPMYLEAGHQVVVFSPFRQMIDLMQAELEGAGIGYSIITGAIKSTSRMDEVKKFQSGQTKVFIGTTSAGGVGIDLFAADILIRLNRDWSPAVEEQAVGRLDRMGQTNPVQVVDIVTRDTIEIEKNQRVELKWTWIQRLLGDI